MVSLFLGSVNWSGVPADEKVVRSTTQPVYLDKPAAMADDMPVQQEYDSDSDPALGMNTRQLASHWVEGEAGTPPYIHNEDLTASQASINRQVASSGTAASREEAGKVRPPLSYAVGIEPVSDLNGAKFGNEYFVREPRDIQETMDAQMTIPPDHQNNAQLSQQGKDNARDAATAGLYRAFWNGGK